MKTVSPEDFLSSQPPKRIIGTECEYNLQTKLDETGLLEDGFRDSYMTDQGITCYVSHGGDIYLSNGGRVAVDLFHNEYSSPEDTGGRGAAVNDLAGVRIMRDFGRNTRGQHSGLFRRTGTDISPLFSVQSCGGSETFTSGYHENYLMPTEKAQDVLDTTLLASYLATRVWAFAGMVGRHGYELSQKANGIGGNPYDTALLERRIREGNKPMVIIRGAGFRFDDYVNTLPDYTRVEVRYADAGTSRWGRFMALSMTSAVLRLIEHADKVDIKESHHLEYPAAAAQEISRDLTFTQKYKTEDGKPATALEIQSRLARGVLKLAEVVRLPVDEVLAAKNVLQIVADLKRCQADIYEVDPVIDAIDWAAKLHNMSNVEDIDPIVPTNADAAAFDLNWDRVYPIGPGEMWWRKIGGRQRILNDSQIDRRKASPPDTTRAHARGTAVKAGLAIPRGWVALKRRDKSYSLKDPFDPRLPLAIQQAYDAHKARAQQT